MSLVGKRILLIVTGGIASYKSPDLVRRLREAGAVVRCAMTEASKNFIQPTVLAAVSGTPVVSELFDPIEGMDVGHVRLAREADLIIIAPATADILGKLAHGIANDLASTILLAADGPVLIAPAMNPKMWDHAAVKRNVATLKADGYQFVGPESGEMAESHEAGVGRMSEPLAILAAAQSIFVASSAALAGRHFVVTSGPTEEPLDPVRYISNRSSGKQGHAIAAALLAEGARVTLVSGPVSVPAPAGAEVKKVSTAAEMLDAVEAALPADGAIFAAAVADWRAASVADEKMKKQDGQEELVIRLVRNPDILATIGHHATRPALVIGFAAETQDLIANAQRKLSSKAADWIFANDVSPAQGVFGGDSNHVHRVSHDGVEDWGGAGKDQTARMIVEKIVEHFGRAER
ncbi:bifunctional phosphopantothenoylcysteine decarboxylase/phosphopantothenate--cysteine ligase CoaBC [Devosia sp. MC521]|uniref:bifunctional phosphopantothenoylcysteine decarboxylase/phosphopantothenate--cysteine ligase CoaBC n=1 Tax=Devosia sp. MC521 TaxID=2759954 RepID=UPI0015F921C0|nr:bifunctional phosphopantothenoylcysteine decarboxylase/phosphopantothenate--cysteine ligase CoaBC [Devosia sp. MC521]MBJ6987917.1 bifunctional phosphopantothenoylcysteine decarboxylase/phosphopantothenate--cysteine ligase CoaBC [Devosia sp. MC521]QMW61997.1 bifunctional phosphopantothenoylcysteine decarboxylase/phosphopantothenate--cysteine ligase CoaBC [Devosia sp. MC521]